MATAWFLLSAGGGLASTVWTSTNDGALWTPVPGTTALGGFFAQGKGFRVFPDGTYLGIFNGGGITSLDVWVSFNAGVNWTKRQGIGANTFQDVVNLIENDRAVVPGGAAAADFRTWRSLDRFVTFDVTDLTGLASGPLGLARLKQGRFAYWTTGTPYQIITSEDGKTWIARGTIPQGQGGAANALGVSGPTDHFIGLAGTSAPPFSAIVDGGDGTTPGAWTTIASSGIAMGTGACLSRTFPEGIPEPGPHLGIWQDVGAGSQRTVITLDGVTWTFHANPIGIPGNQPPTQVIRLADTGTYLVVLTAGSMYRTTDGVNFAGVTFNPAPAGGFMFTNPSAALAAGAGQTFVFPRRGTAQDPGEAQSAPSIGGRRITFL